MCFQCGDGTKHQKQLSLTKKDYDHVCELQDNGTNLSQLFRLMLNSIYNMDAEKKKELKYFLDTEPDLLLRYCKPQASEIAIAWRKKWKVD